MSGSSRRCGTCRWFKDAGMGGTGWCTHPKRQTSSDVRILVRKAELACRNSWGEDFWEALDSADVPDEPAIPTPAAEPIDPNDMPIHISFEDEVTSVVDADIHRAQTRETFSDRMVDEANLDPDDEDDSGDDRFGLLARGGRDSVSEARNRMLRRRSGTLDLPDDDIDREPGHMRFDPDDFVEEEGPARSANEPAQDASPFDDVILSENVPQGSPRSRRIRREHDGQHRPKAAAVVETSPDVPAPAKTPGAADHSVGDPFNTIPEISTDIDISTFRKHRPAGQSRHRAEAQPARESVYEDDIRSAQAIRAAARSEREGRHRQHRRPQILPRATEPVVHQQDDTSAVISELAQSALARQTAPADHPAHVDAPPILTRMSTRTLDDDAVTFEQPRISVESIEQPHSTRPNDPRTSWWRGMFQSREKIGDRPDTGDHTDIGYDHGNLDLDVNNAYADDHEVAPMPASPQRRPEPIVVEDDVQDDWFDDAQPVAADAFTPIDLEADSGMESFRNRLFGGTSAAQAPRTRATGLPEAHIPAEELLEDTADAWYEPEPVPSFDLRRIVKEAPVLLDMTIEIAPDVPRNCATCRSYRQYEKESRGWCTNNWAFTHRQMVNATDLACNSTIGCWWLPDDKEVWLHDREPERKGTPRIDRLIAHLDPLEKVVGS